MLLIMMMIKVVNWRRRSRGRRQRVGRGHWSRELVDGRDDYGHEPGLLVVLLNKDMGLYSEQVGGDGGRGIVVEICHRRGCRLSRRREDPRQRGSLLSKISFGVERSWNGFLNGSQRVLFCVSSRFLISLLVLLIQLC